MRDIREPDLQLAGFSLWVYGYEFPNADDYWDGNWYSVKVRVRAEGASVTAMGTFLRSSELSGFLDQLEVLDRTLSGAARLECLEPNLNLAIEAVSPTGALNLTINVTPEQMSQSHRFLFSIDQSYLKLCIVSCRGILLRYPVRAQHEPH